MERKTDHGGEAAHHDIRNRLKAVHKRCADALCRVDVKDDPTSITAVMRAAASVLKVGDMLYGKPAEAPKARVNEDEDEMQDDDDYPTAYERPAVDTLDAWRELFERKLSRLARANEMAAMVQQSDDGGFEGGLAPVGVPSVEDPGPTVRSLA